MLPEQVFTSETELAVKTDKFLVEEVTVFEGPALEGKPQDWNKSRTDTAPPSTT